MRAFLFTIALGVGLWNRFAFSNNHHEHLPTLFRVADYAVVFDEILELPARELFKGRESDQRIRGARAHVEDLLVRFLDQEPARAHAAAQTIDFHSKLADVLRLFDPDLFKAFRILMEFGEGGIYQHRPSIAYLEINIFRQHLTAQMSAVSFEKVARHYFASEAMQDRSVLDLTVDPKIFLNQRKMVTDLRHLANEFNVELKLFYSISRKAFFSNGNYGTGFLSRAEEQIRQHTKAGLIQGVDIVGSLMGDHSHLNEDVSLNEVERRMRWIFNLCSDLKIDLRIHCFETANRGPFYDVLKKILSSHGKKLHLRIGHIGALRRGNTNEWLNILAEFQAQQKRRFANLDGVVCDVTVASGMILHGTHAEHYRRTMAELKSRGIKVVSGADGRGIFGLRSTYSRQQTTIDEVQQLISEVRLLNFDTLHSSGRIDCEVRLAGS